MNDIELDYGAITIDNSIFKGEGYNFNEGILAQMEQFKGSPVKVIQTDIVHNEAVKHIAHEISKARSTITQALRSASKQLKISDKSIDDAAKLLSIEGDDRTIAEERLKKYYKFIGAQQISSNELVDLPTLMEMYFSTSSPFEEGKDKKNEFPDAIALLSIEAWADINDLKIIAVSADKGWNDFARKSQRITVLPRLSDALEKFQPHNKVASIISHIREDSLLDGENHILTDIENAIINSLEDEHIMIEAASHMSIDWDDVSVSYISHELDINKDGLVDIQIIRIEEDSVTLRTGAHVEVSVEASFIFSVKDSIDRDYVSMGGNVCSVEEDYHTDILLELTGDFSQGIDGIEVSNIEVLESIQTANFGYIEPDWLSQVDDER
ncbi:TPA: DUF4935 domain-containing protein [Enterobacter kobei]|nr:DUF4935 domain-containing protein [Enterobacter cloacae]HCR2080651.1 DUF4935 domain-containing protein [Enterobacter kobei]HCR5054929.1 DUF4935 domain-containing protein [Enterobacter kobei]